MTWYVVDDVCFVYTCRRLIDLSLLSIYMPAIDRPLSDCRYTQEFGEQLQMSKAHEARASGAKLARAAKVSGNDEFCIQNDEFCIKKDVFCI